MTDTERLPLGAHDSSGAMTAAVSALRDAELEADGLRAALRDSEAKIANLEIALVTNRRTAMAIGILMATLRLTEEQAFDRLRLTSQAENRKLRDLAEDVILTGALSETAPRRVVVQPSPPSAG